MSLIFGVEVQPMPRQQPAPKKLPEKQRFAVIDPQATDLVYLKPGEPKARTHQITAKDRSEGIMLYPPEAQYYVEVCTLAPFGQATPEGARGAVLQATLSGENPAASAPQTKSEKPKK